MWKPGSLEFGILVWSIAFSARIVVTYDSNIAFFDGKCFCHHECIQIDNGFMCKCHHGYRLARDGFSCIESEPDKQVLMKESLMIKRKSSSNEIKQDTTSPASKDLHRDVGWTKPNSAHPTYISNHLNSGRGNPIVSSQSSSFLRPKEQASVVNLTSGSSSLSHDELSHESRKMETASEPMVSGGDALAPMLLIQNPTCLDTGCDNNGTCVRHGHRVKCFCPLGTDGEKCNKVVTVKYPKFTGDGYLALPVLRDGYKAFEIDIEFKPSVDDGLLLFSAEKVESMIDFFSLALVDKFLEFRFDCGTGHAIIRSKQTVQFGQWNRVRAKREDNQGFLWLNGKGPVSGYSKGAYSRITLRLNLYLGGYSNITAISRRVGTTSGYVGCVQEIKVNGYKYDLRKSLGDSEHGMNVGECSDRVCDNVECENEGICQAKSADSHICMCPLGTGGKFCQTANKVHIPQFGGHSHLIYPGLGRSSLSFTEIKMMFKPSHPEGLIIYNGYTTDRKGDFISIAMRQGHLEFQFDLGSGPAVLRSFEPVKLHQWHWVHITRTGMQGVMEINNLSKVEGMSQGAFTQLTLTQDLIVGGHRNFDETSKVANLSTGFQGCIQKLILNGRHLNLLGDAVTGMNIDNCKHPCAGQPCMNLGECVPYKGDYTCSCPLGFTDTNCETVVKEEIIVPHFNGNSFLMFHDKEIGKRINGRVIDIQLKFRTNSPNGLIFWTGHQPMMSSRDYLALGLYNGALQFRYNLGGGDAIISYNESVLYDGRWHSLRAQRDRRDGFLEIDQQNIVEGSSDGPYTVLNTNTILYIGDIPYMSKNTLQKYTSGFRGCISDLKLSENYPISLMKRVQRGINIKSCSVT